MQRTTRVTDEAADDIEAIRAWLRQAGAGAKARSRLSALDTAIGRLAGRPYRFQRGKQPGTRKMVVDGYVVIYDVDPDNGRDDGPGEVVVLRVFGPGQDW